MTMVCEYLNICLRSAYRFACYDKCLCFFDLDIKEPGCEPTLFSPYIHGIHLFHINEVASLLI